MLDQEQENKCLSEEQVSEFERNGFLVINNVFTDQEVDEIMEAVKCPRIQEHLTKGPKGFAFHLLEISTLHEIFLKYACHPKIVALLKPLLGENIQLQHSKLTSKLRGETFGEIPWHQDFAYLPHTRHYLILFFPRLYY